MISAKTIEEYKDYMLDHIEHFNAIPCEFEDSTGKVYDANYCWVMAKRLGMIGYDGLLKEEL